MGQRSAGNFATQFAIGQKFETWLAGELCLELVDDLHWQTVYGDTTCRREIKYDRKRHETGNLFIETSESHDVGGKWHDAAITQHAQWLIIGDCQCVWEFSHTVVMDQLKQRPLITLERSKGFLMADYSAERLKTRHWTFPHHPLMVEQ